MMIGSPVRGLLLCALIPACNRLEPKTSDSQSESTDPTTPAEIIAPDCQQAPCGDVQIDSLLGCYDPVNDKSFSITTTLSGYDNQVGCVGADNASGGLDLFVGVLPPVEVEGNDSELWFLIRDYAGEGTYPLYNLGTDYDHIGLKVGGNTFRTDMNASVVVGTVDCVPSQCEAVVAPGSELIPDDPDTVQEFRTRVEIVCPAGSTLTDMHCEPDPGTTCTFTGAPTLTFDLLCSH